MVDRVINIRIDPSGAIVGSKQINRALETTGQKIKGVDAGFRQLTSGLRAFAGALALNEVRKFADTSILLGNRLRLVTDSTAELNAVQSELFDLSQQTRTSFEGSVELFARVARSTKQLGISQQEVIDTTRAVNQAVQISGATAQEASNAIIQFSQGLASGALRGEELRSVLEQVPRLAIALADGLNLSNEALVELGEASPEDQVEVTIGLLRELGAEGELTTARIIDALSRVGPELQAEFDKLNVTSDQALVKLRNSFLVFVGELDEELDFSSGIVAGIDAARNALDKFRGRIPEISDSIAVFVDQAERFGDGFVAAQEAADDFFTFFQKEIIGTDELGITAQNHMRVEWPLTFGVMNDASDDFFSFFLNSLANLPGNVQSLLEIMTVEFTGFFSFLRFQSDKFLIENTAGVGTFFVNMRHVMTAGLFPSANQVLAEGEENLDAMVQALLEFRQNQIKEFEANQKRQEDIRKENRARRAEEAEEERIAREALARAREETGTAKFDPKTQKEAEKLLEKLQKQTTELEEQNEHGEAAEQIGRQRLINELEIGNASQGIINKLNDVNTQLAVALALEEKLKDQADDADAISELEDELALLTAEGDARFRILALQELSVEATDVQKKKYAQLVEEIENAEEAQKNQLITLEEIDREFARGVGNAVGDFLEDVDQGFDGLKNAFSNLMSDLAIEILKNIIVTQFFESFLGFGSAGGGLFSRLFGGAPAAAEGRGVSRNEPVMVGEKGQPEIFIPTQQGNVVPFNKLGGGGDTVIINEQDPAGLLATMNTQGGLKVQRNFVTTSNRFVKRSLGVR